MSVTHQSRETTRTNGSTRVVMLGTGTPRPDPNCAGPATIVVANNTPYLIDFGPGVMVWLGPAIRPNHVVKTGAGLPFGSHAEVDIDLLLTCDSIKEAREKTKERDRLAKERGRA